MKRFSLREILRVKSANRFVNLLFSRGSVQRAKLDTPSWGSDIGYFYSGKRIKQRVHTFMAMNGDDGKFYGPVHSVYIPFFENKWGLRFFSLSLSFFLSFFFFLK